MLLPLAANPLLLSPEASRQTLYVKNRKFRVQMTRLTDHGGACTCAPRKSRRGSWHAARPGYTFLPRRPLAGFPGNLANVDVLCPSA